MVSPRSRLSRRAIEALLVAGLTDLRQGRAVAPGNRYRRLREGLERPLLQTLTSTIGDLVPVAERDGEAVRVLLQWAIEQLRPDRRPGLEGVDERAWLHSTSWRPLLAMACHHGLLSIPDFPGRYRRHPAESAIENLCGIWAVGPSTVYRYLDKGRRQLVDLFDGPPLSGSQLLSLRRNAHAWLNRRPPPASGWPAWHQARADACLLGGDVSNALWHLSRSGEFGTLLDVLRRHGSEAAGSPETDALLTELENDNGLGVDKRIELDLRRALLSHYRHDITRENEALGRALRSAELHGEPSLLGMAQAAMARFFEERDRDRAIACYEESLGYLKRVIEQPGHPNRNRAVNEYASGLVHLAWLYLRRNNPKAKTLLEQFANVSAGTPLEEETIGALEQTWGEYWRCVGNPRQALEHKHRALAIFERIGDLRSTLSTYNNLSLIYSDSKDFEQAIEYGSKVVAAAKHQSVEPELLSSVHCNLGVAYFSLGHLDQAITHYEASRAAAEQAGLRSLLVVSQYNLAEAHYERFKQHADRQDELQGDSYAAAAARLSTEDKAHAQAEAARALKREILGTGEGPDRLLPAEHAAHFAEMTEIERLRLGLALPQAAEEQVRVHLAIARAYLAIATKEREAALAIASRHGLQSADFQGELETLRSTFSRELTREQHLYEAWNSRSSDLLAKERRQSVLTHVLAQGSINKSTYAEVAAVSLATASKHLGLLAERGLLVQTGKGPSTRYLLPAQ
jgi:tetratricopeptide (TPR) repeat protein